MRVALIAPDALLDDRAFLRIHNKAAKDALRECAITHWKTRIPGHFRKQSQAKYGYEPRKPIYRTLKARRMKSRTDLVYSGKTRDAVTSTQPTIRAGGRAANPDGSSGQLKLSMTMKLPFGVDAQKSVAKAVRRGKYSRGHVSGEHRPGVTIADMSSEIAAITTDEAKDIGQQFAKLYGEKLKAALATRPKIRKRLDAAQSGGAIGKAA